MEDPSFPFSDLYDSPFSPSFFNISNPTLDDLSNSGPTAALPQQNHHAVQQGQGSNEQPFSDPMVIQDQYVHNNNLISFGGAANFEAGPSQMHGDQSQPANENPGSLNPNEVLALEYWPPAPLPFFCSCCQVLREIIHTKGTYFEKLEIHGRLGYITHAIHRQNINGDSSNLQHQMIDFCRRSIEEIKTFLEQYCMQRSSAGYFIMQDPMSSYYETLCTGLDWTDDFNDADDMEQEGVNGTTNKINLSIQRNRAGKMRLSDFKDLFHLPIEEAADHVKLCPTVVKKICRKEGLARWPHRKVKSIMKQISLLASGLNSEDAASRARTQAEIDKLKQEMIRHCGGVAPSAMHNVPQQPQ